jgi:hypothetical protein
MRNTKTETTDDMGGVIYALIVTVIISIFLIPAIGVIFTRRMESKSNDLLGPGEQS